MRFLLRKSITLDKRSSLRGPCNDALTGAVEDPRRDHTAGVDDAKTQDSREGDTASLMSQKTAEVFVAKLEEYIEEAKADVAAGSPDGDEFED
jgi:hypothetical protein